MEILLALRRQRRLILASYALWVTVITLAPLPSGAGRLPWWFDKVVHFGLFGGVGFLVYFNLGYTARHRVMLVSGVAAVFAALIEIVQSPLAFRSGDVWDFVWGAAGGLVGWVTAEAADRWIKRRWETAGDGERR